jgi:hypothetical protein
VNGTSGLPAPVRDWRPRRRAVAGKLAALVLAVSVANHTAAFVPVHAGAGTVPMGGRVLVIWLAHKTAQWSQLSQCLTASLLPATRSRPACWRINRTPNADGMSPAVTSRPKTAVGVGGAGDAVSQPVTSATSNPPVRPARAYLPHSHSAANPGVRHPPCGP